jgi:hypothetical protein
MNIIVLNVEVLGEYTLVKEPQIVILLFHPFRRLNLIAANRVIKYVS